MSVTATCTRIATLNSAATKFHCKLEDTKTRRPEEDANSRGEDEEAVVL